MTTHASIPDVVVAGFGVVTCRYDSADACARGIPSAQPLAAFAGAAEGASRGGRFLSKPTRYLLAAVASAVQEAGPAALGHQRGRRGTAIGTNLADHGVREAMDRVVLREGAMSLSPAEAPNSSVNIPASHVSIRHQCQGFCVTLTTPTVAGLQAVALGAQALARGALNAVIAGATEDAWPHSDALEPDLGGACAMVLQPRSTTNQGAGVAICATLSRFASPQWLALDANRKALQCALHQFLDLSPRGAIVRRHDRAPHLAALLDSVFGPKARQREGAPQTLGPLLDLASAHSERRPTTLIATSPLGHLVLLSAKPVSGAIAPAFSSNNKENRHEHCT